MHNKILLGVAISIAAMQTAAVPFQVVDARSMAMGGTGVASAQISTIVPFNSALLASYRADDHFSLTLPRVAIFGSDEDDFIDAVSDFDDAKYFDNFSTTIDNVSTDIENLSGSLDGTLAGDLGVTTALDNIITDSANITQADLDTLDTNIAGSSITRFNNATTSLKANAGTGGVLSQQVLDLNTGLSSLGGKALRGGFGGGMSFAIPSKKFGVSVSIDTTITGSGLLTVKQKDLNLLTDYTGATGGYVDVSADFATDIVQFSTLTAKFAAFAKNPFLNPPLTSQEEDQFQLFIKGDDGDTETADSNSIAASQNALSNYSYTNADGEVIIQNNELTAADPDLESTAHFFGIAVTDIALGIGRMFEISGENIAFGLTPKLQRIDVFDVIYQLDGQDQNGLDVNFDDIKVKDYHKEFTEFNIDAGIAYRFGSNERWQIGGSIKNLMSKSFTSIEGKEIDLNTMLRTGLSYENADYWLKPKIAMDLDVTENKPTAFEEPTRYFGIGAEIDLFRTVQLRAGYRTNLAGSDQEVVTAGIGFSPFVVHFDLAFMVNPSDPAKEAGAAFEMGIEF